MTSLISHSSQVAVAKDGELIKQDRLGRVCVSDQRRRALLAEFDASFMGAFEFSRLAGIKCQTFAAWDLKRRRTALKPEQGRRTATARWLAVAWGASVRFPGQKRCA